MSAAERPRAELRAGAPTLVIAPRFCGPPGTGNGGYVAGRLAGHVAAPDEPVEVTLRRPTPLATPLVAAPAAPGTWTLAAADGTPLAEARPAGAALDAEPPLRPRRGEVVPVARRADHPFPRCFVCGPGRRHGDGLRIAPVRLRPGVVAAPWTAPADLADPTGAVDPAVVWAALDCPGYFAIADDGPLRPMLLGRITAAVEASVRADGRYLVVGWTLGSERRRHRAATALVDGEGRVLARSRQVWIEPRTE